MRAKIEHCAKKTAKVFSKALRAGITNTSLKKISWKTLMKSITKKVRNLAALNECVSQFLSRSFNYHQNKSTHYTENNLLLSVKLIYSCSTHEIFEKSRNKSISRKKIFFCLRWFVNSERFWHTSFLQKVASSNFLSFSSFMHLSKGGKIVYFFCFS